MVDTFIFHSMRKLYMALKNKDAYCENICQKKRGSCVLI